MTLIIIIVMNNDHNYNKNHTANSHDRLYYESWKRQLKAHTAVTTVTVDLNFEEYFVNYHAILIFTFESEGHHSCM